MAATLEPVVSIGARTHVWIARSGPDHVRYGDTYAVACIVTRVDEDTVRIEGLASDDRHVTRELLALREALSREGFKHVLWQRIRNQMVKLI